MKRAVCILLMAWATHAAALDMSLLKNVEARRDHEFLAELKADPAASSAVLAHQLRLAAYSGFPDSLDWLLSGPAAVPAPGDKDGFTALMTTFLHPKYLPTEYTIVSRLLAKGADANLQNANGQTALMLFLEARGASQLRGEPIACDAEADGAKLIAWRNAEALAEFEMASFRLLLKASRDVNVRDRAGRTALVLASERRLEEMMGALLEAGAEAEIEIPESQRRTPLFFASSGLVPQLVARGADPNRLDGKGDSVLHAAMRSRLRTPLELRAYVKALLAAGAKDRLDRQGEFASDATSPYAICPGPMQDLLRETRAAIRASR